MIYFDRLERELGEGLDEKAVNEALEKAKKLGFIDLLMLRTIIQKELDSRAKDLSKNRPELEDLLGDLGFVV